MSWHSYYRLLRKYNGDLELANEVELIDAAKSNPGNPQRALKIATKKWEDEQDRLSNEIWDMERGN